MEEMEKRQQWAGECVTGERREGKTGEALTITMQLERDGDSERVQLGSEWTGVAVVVQQGAPRAL
jgi:hypothetical protein